MQTVFNRRRWITAIIVLVLLSPVKNYLFASPVNSTAIDSDDSLFQVGEELTYNVSYTFIDIGQVRIKVTGKTDEKGTTSYKAFAHIDSYKGLPLVNLHTTYESTISESLFSQWFKGRTKEDTLWRTVTYQFDYPNQRIYIEHWDNLNKRDTVHIKSRYQDGLSMFFYARHYLRTNQTLNVPVIVNEKLGSTSLHYTNEQTHEKIDAVEYPVDVIYFDGKADFVGVFGLTGEFEGWFSNDYARVPIIAKMKVILGNIRIELMKWKREGWEPPRYVEGKSK